MNSLAENHQGLVLFMGRVYSRKSIPIIVTTTTVVIVAVEIRKSNSSSCSSSSSLLEEQRPVLNSRWRRKNVRRRRFAFPRVCGLWSSRDARSKSRKKIQHSMRNLFDKISNISIYYIVYISHCSPSLSSRRGEAWPVRPVTCHQDMSCTPGGRHTNPRFNEFTLIILPGTNTSGATCCYVILSRVPRVPG